MCRVSAERGELSYPGAAAGSPVVDEVAAVEAVLQAVLEHPLVGGTAALGLDPPDPVHVIQVHSQALAHVRDVRRPRAVAWTRDGAAQRLQYRQLLAPHSQTGVPQTYISHRDHAGRRSTWRSSDELQKRTKTKKEA